MGHKAAIVVAFPQGDKPLATLAQDEGFGGLALRVEGIEFLIEAFVGGLARIDGATELANGCSQERVSFRLECAIQDQSPFSCHARAVALRERAPGALSSVFPVSWSPEGAADSLRARA